MVRQDHSAFDLGIPPERFTSQAFWDAFEKILPEHLDPLASGDDDPLDRAQLRLLDLWKGKQMVSRRLLAYDTTNFYTISPATTRATNSPNAGITNKAVTTYVKWASATFWTSAV